VKTVQDIVRTYLDHSCILHQGGLLGRDRALAFLCGEDSGLLALRRPQLRLDRSLGHGSFGKDRCDAMRCDAMRCDAQTDLTQTALQLCWGAE
jgi:hypothetical protein